MAGQKVPIFSTELALSNSMLLCGTAPHRDDRAPAIVPNNSAQHARRPANLRRAECEESNQMIVLFTWLSAEDGSPAPIDISRL
jgi:hypothetical protein